MSLSDPPTDIVVELPLEAWRSFPDGQKLGAELRRLADLDAESRGRTVRDLASVSSDKDRGVYVAIFRLNPASA